MRQQTKQNYQPVQTVHRPLLATLCLFVTLVLSGATPASAASQRWNGSLITSASSIPAISCTSTTNCTAIAYPPSSQNTALPVIINYKGSAWSLTSLPYNMSQWLQSPQKIDTTLTTPLPARQLTTELHVAPLSGPLPQNSQMLVAKTRNQVTLTAAATKGDTLLHVAPFTSIARLPQGAELDYISHIGQPDNDNLPESSFLSCSQTTCVATIGVTTNSVVIKSDDTTTILSTASATRTFFTTGTSWSRIQNLPPGAKITGVSCATKTLCIAVGSKKTIPPTPLALQLVNSSWTTLALPTAVTANPAGVTLNGVSCPAPSFCLGIGSSYGTLGTNIILADNNNAWTLLSSQKHQAPGTDQSLITSDVSCSTPTHCVLSGLSTDSSDVAVETLNGSTWSATSAPGTMNVFPYGLSCVETTCANVGAYQSNSGLGYSLFAQTLDAGAWSTTTLTSPPPTQNSQANAPALTAVSCPTTTWCIASGYAAQVQGGTTTHGVLYTGTP